MPSHKCHSALHRCPTMHRIVKEMCTCVHISVTKWCILGHGSGASQDLCNRSIKSNDADNYVGFQAVFQRGGFQLSAPLLCWEMIGNENISSLIFKKNHHTMVKWMKGYQRIDYPWWHHVTKTLFALLAPCGGIMPVTRDFPPQRASYAELWCWSKQAVEQTVDFRWSETTSRSCDISTEWRAHYPDVI